MLALYRQVCCYLPVSAAILACRKLRGQAWRIGRNREAHEEIDRSALPRQNSISGTQCLSGGF